MPVGWEFESVSRRPFLCCDYEGARSLVCKFLLWSWEVKVGCVEPNLVSYLIFDCQAFLFAILGFHLVGSFLE